MFKIKTQTRGGHNIRRHIAEARSARGTRSVAVGFFSSDRYPDDTPVTNVAAWHEYGTKRIKERPFMRQAVERLRPSDLAMLADADPSRLVITKDMANRLGRRVATEIQATITEYKEREDALVDTGLMRASVTWRVED